MIIYIYICENKIKAWKITKISVVPRIWTKWYGARSLYATATVWNDLRANRLMEADFIAGLKGRLKTNLFNSYFPQQHASLFLVLSVYIVLHFVSCIHVFNLTTVYFFCFLKLYFNYNLFTNCLFNKTTILSYITI